jgi:hypothetical protein
MLLKGAADLLRLQSAVIAASDFSNEEAAG